MAVVLGTVLLLAPKKTYNISEFNWQALSSSNMMHTCFHVTDPLDFMRNIIAYIIVLVIIVAVAYDGKVCVNGSAKCLVGLPFIQGYASTLRAIFRDSEGGGEVTAPPKLAIERCCIIKYLAHNFVCLCLTSPPVKFS